LTADVNEVDDDDDDLPNAPGGPSDAGNGNGNSNGNSNGKPPRADVYAIVPPDDNDDAADDDEPADRRTMKTATTTPPTKKKKMSYYALSQLPQLEAFEWQLLGIKPPTNLRTKIEEMQADAQTEASAANKTERTPPTAPILWTPNKRPAVPTTPVATPTTNLLPPPRSASSSSSSSGLALLPPTKRK
jgi:hypothetical protein